MKNEKPPVKKVQIAFSKKIGMVLPYVQKRIMEQVKSVAMIVLYLALFQIFILGIPIIKAALIASGIALVVMGLAFFMEGLMLGLMPLGETIGVKLPQKSKLPVILIFAFILGVGATFAEPAIGVLKAAGESVKAWNAPLLFLILNKFSNYLVYAVGAGVGIAVLSGMLMFMYNWSLKPFIYVLVTLLTALSIFAYFHPNLIHLSGLAWDCGGVTTGPVTVPLVLALGIGISRIVSKGNSAMGGFGVVTLASVFPVLTVFMLGIVFMGTVPNPMKADEFFSPAHRGQVRELFVSDAELTGYVLKNTEETTHVVYFENSKEKMLEYLKQLSQNADLQQQVFGSTADFEKWAASKASPAQRNVFKEISDSEKASRGVSAPVSELDAGDIFSRNGLASIQAIIPLSILLLLTLLIVLREKLKRFDEVLLGLVFAVIGMTLFNIGIEIGLSRLGNQVGEKLPASFKSIMLQEQKKVISGFEANLVQTAINAEGQTEQFFYFNDSHKITTLPYEQENFNAESKQYTYVPAIGPLFGKEGGVSGIIVVLIFAFVMGYGATLAEPALNALGLTVEELSVGTFKKSLLMNTVAFGVGLGIMLGMVKIIWNLPLVWMLAPPYLILLFVSKISTDEFVSIGWDSAGVTTGPITVPLVLAMGLGISGQVGVIEGFGILSMASVMPILSVLSVGLYVNKKRQAALQEASNNDK